MAKKNKTAAEKMNQDHLKKLADANKHPNAMLEAQKKRQAEAEKKAKEAQELAKQQHEEALEITAAYKEEIEAYLNGEQLFDEGYALLMKFSTNVCLLAQIQRKSLQSKMIYELEKLLVKEIIKPSPRSIQSKPQRKVVQLGKVQNKLSKDAPTLEKELSDEDRQAAFDDFKTASGSGVNPDDLPEEIKVYYDKACKHYRIFQHWHEVMKLAKTDEERSAALSKAKANEEFKTECWAKIDQWVKDGKTPGTVENNSDTSGNELPGEVAAEIAKAKSYISRQLKTLEKKEGKPYDEQKEKLKERIELLKKYDLVPEKHKPMLLKHGLISEN